MKPFLRVLFWVYFGIASLAFILVIIFLIRKYQVFKEENNFNREEESFTRYFIGFPKTDSSFTGLFNHPAEAAIDYLNADATYYDKGPAKAKAVPISAEEIRQLDSLIQYWPARFRELHQEHILAVYLVDTASFNGRTQVIAKGADRYIIYLNRALFNNRPNDWITRETTHCLQEEYRPFVRAHLFTPEQNIPIKLVEHVLLHEYAHVFSFVHGHAPAAGEGFTGKQGYFPLIETCFTSGKISYEINEEGLGQLQQLSAKPQNEYEKVDLNTFRQLSHSLVQSSFPTGYSTRNSTELVAELFTLYIHQQYLHQQFYMTFNNSDTLYFARQMDEGYMRGLLE